MEIRGYTEADRPELTALASHVGEGSPTATLWGHPESEKAVYLDPYMDLEPESLFLAVDDGRLVGYLTGCVDSTSFPTEEARLESAIRHYRLISRRKPATFFARALADTLVARVRRLPLAAELTDPRWPSHLHINLTPSARGTGAADTLMHHFLDHLAANNSPGCYLQTLVENSRAVRFFERHGFTAHGAPAAVPGLRYKASKVHQLTMIRATSSLQIED
ncbi:GNAT family N-acetyltransferase [Nocardia caishijiensis]|uniref:Acetyltransferase (GNAT) family protein n=1 Tax=Nocardia caishijiensis TaxID=184756 RepID=A0ABQ6YFB2_9NOCA|nr:GNAT family N-acetyltransferase [Nocardia caishijiensis]KAF0836683.1 acetyltransferase (GNAT) family protein [Nocardia caishijiensis]